MLTIPNAIFSEFAAHLAIRNIPPSRIVEYKKWLRYYLDFCDKYPVPANRGERVRLFCEKLQHKNQSAEQRERAAHAVSLYFEIQKTGTPRPAQPAGEPISAVSRLTAASDDGSNRPRGIGVGPT